MLPPPPASTLFPYTTLFRSLVRELARDELVRLVDRGRNDHHERDHAHQHISADERDRARGGDRKSTRLNSSHVSISYAVFCLKKKNMKVHRAHAAPRPRNTK